MAATILDGRAFAAELREALKARAIAARERGIVPRLTVAVVGTDESSAAYVRSLVRAGTNAGIDVTVDELPEQINATLLCERLTAYGLDDSIHGVMLQQPLPRHLSMSTASLFIPVAKDVDAANPVNQAMVGIRGERRFFVPATPRAVMLILERSKSWPLRGKDAVVVGRSTVVGRPAALLLLGADATVTIAHSRTNDLAQTVRRAEVVVAAAGKPGLIDGSMLRPGCTVIDVGTSVVDGKLTGDVDFESAVAVASEITPVPGGVGPMTTVALLSAVLDAVDAQQSNRRA